MRPRFTLRRMRSVHVIIATTMLAVPASALAFTGVTSVPGQSVQNPVQTPLNLQVSPRRVKFGEAVTISGTAPAADAGKRVLRADGGQGASRRGARWARRRSAPPARSGARHPAPLGPAARGRAGAGRGRLRQPHGAGERRRTSIRAEPAADGHGGRPVHPGAPRVGRAEQPAGPRRRQAAARAARAAGCACRARGAHGWHTLSTGRTGARGGYRLSVRARRRRRPAGCGWCSPVTAATRDAVAPGRPRHRAAPGSGVLV